MKPLTAVNGTVDGNKWNWREQFPSTASTKSTQSTLKEVGACGVWKSEHLWTKWTWWTRWTRWTLWTGILEPHTESVYSFQATFRRHILQLYNFYFYNFFSHPHAETGNILARRYLTGDGTPRDPQKAQACYAAGAREGDTFAKEQLKSLTQALDNPAMNTDSEAVEDYCRLELFKSCGIKFKE